MPSEQFCTRRGSVWERTNFAGKSLPEIRDEMEALALSEVRHYDDVVWEKGTLGGISGKWVRPMKKSKGMVYYVHGGGFTLGSSGIPLPFLMELSHRLGVTCFSADYRLAPEYTFPAAPEDAFAGYRELLAQGWRPEQIAVCGESAGATLVLGIPLMARKVGIAAPKAVVAMSPVTDATCAANGTVLEGLEGTDQVMNTYAPGHDRADPLLSPALGELKDFPPVFLSAGGAEVLMGDALLFADRAARAGVDVHLHIGKDMIHTYPLDLWDYPEAMEAFEEIADFLNRQICQ